MKLTQFLKSAVWLCCAEVQSAAQVPLWLIGLNQWPTCSETSSYLGLTMPQAISCVPFPLSLFLSLLTYFAAPSSKCYKMPIKKPSVWSVSASVSKTRKTPWYAKSWGNTKSIQKCQMCKVTLCKYLCFVIKTQENLIGYN